MVHGDQPLNLERKVWRPDSEPEIQEPLASVIPSAEDAKPMRDKIWTPVGRYTGRGPKNFTRADERIKEDFCQALEKHGEVDASELEVEVRQGQITVRGYLGDDRQKRIVEELARLVWGAKDISCEIQLSGQVSDDGNVHPILTEAL